MRFVDLAEQPGAVDGDFYLPSFAAVGIGEVLAGRSPAVDRRGGVDWDVVGWVSSSLDDDANSRTHPSLIRAALTYPHVVWKFR